MALFHFLDKELGKNCVLCGWIWYFDVGSFRLSLVPWRLKKWNVQAWPGCNWLNWPRCGNSDDCAVLLLVVHSPLLFTEQSRSYKADIFSASGDSLCIFQNLNVRYYVPKSPPLVFILIQINPVHAHPSHSFNSHFNIIILSLPRSSKWIFSSFLEAFPRLVILWHCCSCALSSAEACYCRHPPPPPLSSSSSSPLPLLFFFLFFLLLLLLVLQ